MANKTVILTVVNVAESIHGADNVPEKLNFVCAEQADLSSSGTSSAPVELRRIITSCKQLQIFRHHRTCKNHREHFWAWYVEVAAMKKTIKSSEVTSTPKSILTRHGILQQVRSDNGPQFDNVEFSYFAKEWGFKHTTSSPRFLPSNGEVERGVRNVKNLLSKERDPAKGLLAYRLTPLACKFSPAQLLMGRQIRNGVPVFHTQLNPQ
nr:uncharacterized protein LOC131769759 [Pocillopora verrucosa]